MEIKLRKESFPQMLTPEIPITEHGAPMPGSGNKPGTPLQVLCCSRQEDGHLSEQGDFLSLLNQQLAPGDQLHSDTSFLNSCF